MCYNFYGSDPAVSGWSRAGFTAGITAAERGMRPTMKNVFCRVAVLSFLFILLPNALLAQEALTATAGENPGTSSAVIAGLETGNAQAEPDPANPEAQNPDSANAVQENAGTQNQENAFPVLPFALICGAIFLVCTVVTAFIVAKMRT